MDRVLFSFAQIVETLPTKRNKHYKRDFAWVFNDGSYEYVRNALINYLGDEALVSNIKITEDVCDLTGRFNHVIISFSYTYYDLQPTTPWDIAQSRAITFLLCAKHLGLHKDVTLLIAKRVYIDVSIDEAYTFSWRHGSPVTWNGTRWDGRKACISCKYPCPFDYCTKCETLKG